MTPDPVRVVEAALFSAGKPVTLEDICQATKLKPEDVTPALKQLHKEYADRPGALEVVKSGPKWAMAVRTEFVEHTKMLAPPEVPRRVLKTLALIAFHQPIKQADLKDMVGSVVYEHVHELYDRGLVSGRQEGVTKILTTTDRFLDYFGIDAEKPEEIKTALAKKVGLDLSALQKPPEPKPEGGQTTLDASPAAAGTDESLPNLAEPVL